MITYVNTVLVSNLNSASILKAMPAKAESMQTPSADAGKFIIQKIPYSISIPNEDLYPVKQSFKFKIGVVTKQNTIIRHKDGSVEYTPIIKWSNEIDPDYIKSFSILSSEAPYYLNSKKEDTVVINFANLSADTLAKFAEGGKRIIVRLTFKDLPTRYRSWTESYEYVTMEGDTKETICAGIANMITKEWKRARVSAKASGETVEIVALPYDDDNSSESINWANKVRFNANIYYTDPMAAAWASKNKYFPTGVEINKTPGKAYPATGKLVRDREAQAMGYQGILNRGEGTWPVIKPAVEADINTDYDAIVLEFENMYRAADDIQRHTKQTVEVYGTASHITNLCEELFAMAIVPNGSGTVTTE